MTRARLAKRRNNLTIERIKFDGDGGDLFFTLTVGFDAAGKVGEIFISGLKFGSTLDALMADAAVAISRLLQSGTSATELAASMGRLGDQRPASLLGAAVDAAAEVERGE